MIVAGTRLPANAASMSSHSAWAMSQGIAVGGVLLGMYVSWLGFPLEGGAAAVIAIAPLFVVLDRTFTPSLLVGPCTVLAAFHVLGYAIGPLGQRHFSAMGIERFDSEGLVPAQWGAVAGMLTYAIGYALMFHLVPRGARRRGVIRPGDFARWDLYGLALLAVAVTILAFGYVTGATRRLGEAYEGPAIAVAIAVGVANVHQIVFFFLALSAGRHRTLRWIGLWALALTAYAAFFFLEGGRGTVITTILYSALGFGMAGIAWRRILGALALVAVALIPLTAVVVEYRSNSSAAYAEGLLASVDAFETAASSLITGNSEHSWTIMDTVIYGVSVLTVDRVILLTPREIPYAGLDDLERAALLWTPRFINPDKEGVQDGHEVAGRYGVGGVGYAVYMPTVGEGYRRFGWLGVPIVYFLASMVYGGVAAFAWNRRDRPAWAAVLMFIIIGAGGAWSSTILSLVYQAGWVIPKFILFFLAVGAVIDVLAPVRARRRRAA